MLHLVLLPHPPCLVTPDIPIQQIQAEPAVKVSGLRPILLLLTAIGPTSFQIFLPSLPSIQWEFEVSRGIAQLSLSLSMLGIAVATLIYGRLSDRFGRKPMLLLGIILLLTGSVFCAFAPTMELLILGRVIQAAGGASGMIIGRAIVVDVYGQARPPVFWSSCSQP